MTPPRSILSLLAGLALAFAAAAPPAGAQSAAAPERPRPPRAAQRPPPAETRPAVDAPPAAVAGPTPEPAAASPEPLPAMPAPAPPAPANLAATPRPAQPPRAPPRPPLAVPPGMEALPLGGLRLRFAADAETLPPAARASLTELGQLLAAGPPGRVVLTGQASGPAADVSVARRLSLARALAVKQALADGGLPATRIDIRPLGRTADVVDAVDVQPPEPEPAR